MSRKLEIVMETTKGDIDRYYAFVNGHRRIKEFGTVKGKFTGQVRDKGTLIKFRAYGTSGSQYKVTIKLDKKSKEKTFTIPADGVHEDEHEY